MATRMWCVCSPELAVQDHADQEQWSRFTGGSGAPLWTFHVAGLDPTMFTATCAASLDAPKTSSSLSTPSGRLWPTNYSKFAVATMFTLFFAGEVFAPKALYNGPNAEFFGKNIGHVLRTSYTRAFTHLMTRLKDCSNVLGVDPMNEPHPGYIGLPSLHFFNETTELHLGHMPNALQSMALAAGVPTGVPYFSRSWPHPSRITRIDMLNEDRITAWLPGASDIWQDERVFTISSSGNVELGPKGLSYFFNHPITGAQIDFEREFYVPFVRSFHHAVIEAVAGGKAGTWLFVEPVPNLGPPEWVSPTSAQEMICYSPHWYDIRALYEKGFSYTVSFDVLSLAAGSRNFLAHTYFGRPGLTKNYSANFARFWSHLSTLRRGSPSPTPILIGETGVPWDMNHQEAYNTGNVNHQLTMTDAILHAMERAGALSWTFWNLALSHHTGGAATKVDNETAAPFQSGDGWNSEDFSIVSSDPATTELPLGHYRDAGVRPHVNGVPLTRAALFGDLYRGLRAAPAFLRPYPFATAGKIIKSEFLLDLCRFELEFSVRTHGGPQEARTTEIFVPAYHFWGRKVLVRFWTHVPGKQVRSEEFVMKWDFMEDTACAGALTWRWECGNQALMVLHSAALVEGTKVGVVVEAETEERAVGWAEMVGGWFS
jgi:hypothetical protein